MRWLGLVLALAGCQKIFSIEKLPDVAPGDGPTCPADIGHDEDGDCIADAKDNCPGIANKAQLDGDRDGIGDECDPNPGQIGNQLLVFVPFDTISEESMWSTIGAWTVGGDDYVNMDSTSGGEDWTYRMSMMYGAGAELEARITVGAFTAGDDIKVGAGFYGGAATGVPPEWSCSVHVASTGGPVVDAYDNGVAASRPLAPSTLFATGATYSYRMKVAATQVACDIRGEAGDVGAATTTNPSPLATAGFLALYTQSAGAQVHYVAVYSAM